jgi:glycosyltransferase involved in cell wall biosynthesis
MSDELQTYFRGTLSRKLAKVCGDILDGFVPKKADFCLALSEEVASFLITQGVCRDQLLVLPPGIDHPEPVTKPPPVIRKRFGLREGPIVIYAGNLDNYQNIDLLLQSFAVVVRELPDALLVVASNYDPGSYAAVVRDRSLSRHVVFRSFSSFEEVWHLLAASDVAVSARTSWSGFPIKILNYMAAAKAIVAFEGSAKGIEHLVSGYVVRNSSVSEFAKAIVELLKDEDLRTRLGENAKRIVGERYSWDGLVPEVEKVYAHVASRRTHLGSR